MFSLILLDYRRSASSWGRNERPRNPFLPVVRTSFHSLIHVIYSFILCFYSSFLITGGLQAVGAVMGVLGTLSYPSFRRRFIHSFIHLFIHFMFSLILLDYRRSASSGGRNGRPRNPFLLVIPTSFHSFLHSFICSFIHSTLITSGGLQAVGAVMGVLGTLSYPLFRSHFIH